MNYYFLVAVALFSAAVSGSVFFWLGHEHGVNSSAKYQKRRYEYLESAHPSLRSGNVRLMYGSDKRPSN